MFTFHFNFENKIYLVFITSIVLAINFRTTFKNVDLYMDQILTFINSSLSECIKYGDDEENEKNQILTQLESEEAWKTIDGLNTISLKESEYTFDFDNMQEAGLYSMMKIGTYDVLALRSTSFNTVLNPFYALEFGTKTVTETVKKKTVEKIVTDYDTIIFTPVKITPTDCFATEGKAYTFVRQAE